MYHVRFLQYFHLPFDQSSNLEHPIHFPNFLKIINQEYNNSIDDTIYSFQFKFVTHCVLTRSAVANFYQFFFTYSNDI